MSPRRSECVEWAEEECEGHAYEEEEEEVGPSSKVFAGGRTDDFVLNMAT